jgi:mannosyltransferase
MQDPQRALQMGQAAQQRVAERFSLAQEAAGIGRVYQQLFDAACA